MLSKETIRLARERAQAVTGVALPWDVTVQACAGGLTVTLENGKASIEAEGVNALTRGFFLLSRAVKEGKNVMRVRQERHFAACGAMVDCSRNAVLKVEAVKRYIDQMACLGMNMLMLYTEDTFVVPEYPAMGYLRGGYTQAQLREIDDYAASLGVELIPCIQTLAHLSQFLQWSTSAPLVDTADVLLIDEPQTYAFIEAEIRAVSSCVRSRRIHIGMDEAHGVGLGRYYAKHGPQDRFELLSRHLNRVVGICTQYGLEPIMWSDMFFRLGSKTNEYYDKEAVVPQSVIDVMPKVDLCYWDYYHTDEDMYDAMLTRHEQMGQRTLFAGGIWTWSGFLPQVKLTQASMRVGLRVCAKHRVDTVFATLWGDDGAETNVMLGSSLLPIFSEACWQGPDYDERDAVLAGECLTGLPRRVLDAWGDFYASERDRRPGKQLIWGDPLYPMTVLDEGESYEAIIARSEAAIETMKPYQNMMECRYATLLFEVCIAKAQMISQIRSRYLAGDRQWLGALVNEGIPALRALYEQLMRAHRALWERDNKRFGWEVLCLRYGGVLARLDDVKEELARYLRGELETIEELDAQPQGIKKRAGHSMYGKLCVPARDFWAAL